MGGTQLLQTRFRAGLNIPLGRFDLSREFWVNTESRVRCLGQGDNEQWVCAGCMTAGCMTHVTCDTCMTQSESRKATNVKYTLDFKDYTLVDNMTTTCGNDKLLDILR